MQVVVLAAAIVASVLLTREVWPRTEREIVRIPEPVVIDLSDSTRADYEAAEGALRATIERQDRLLRDMARRPPAVTAETTFVEVPVAVACEADSFEPRWRIRDLTVGRDVGDETILRAERFAADSGQIVITPQTEQHVTLGPLIGAFPRADGTGVRLEFGNPPPKPCGFWCSVQKVALGAAIGSGVTAAACIGG